MMQLLIEISLAQLCPCIYNTEIMLNVCYMLGVWVMALLYLISIWEVVYICIVTDLHHVTVM